MIGGPIIIRDLAERQLQTLASKGILAFAPVFRLEPGTQLMIWWEEEARWLYARVRRVIEKPGLRDYESLLELSGYESVEEWLGSEERRIGIVPRRIVIVEVDNE